MNLLSRLIMLLIISASLAAPAVAAVKALDPAGSCDLIAADDDKKKPEGDKKPGGDEEPDCD